MEGGGAATADEGGAAAVGGAATADEGGAAAVVGGGAFRGIAAPQAAQNFFAGTEARHIGHDATVSAEAMFTLWRAEIRRLQATTAPVCGEARTNLHSGVNVVNITCVRARAFEHKMEFEGSVRRRVAPSASAPDSLDRSAKAASAVFASYRSFLAQESLSNVRN